MGTTNLKILTTGPMHGGNISDNFTSLSEREFRGMIRVCCAEYNQPRGHDIPYSLVEHEFEDNIVQLTDQALLIFLSTKSRHQLTRLPASQKPRVPRQ